MYSLSQSSMPASQAKAIESGQQLQFGGWCMYKSFNKTQDGGFLQVEQIQTFWNRKDASW